MIKPEIKRLTKDDATMARGLRSVVLQGKFEMKGDAICAVASLLKWLESLDVRIEETLKPLLPPPPPRPLESTLEAQPLADKKIKKGK